MSKSGVTKKEYLKLKKKLLKLQAEGKNWNGLEFCKVMAYYNNKPYKEIFEMMVRDTESGKLKVAEIGGLH